MRYIDKSLPPYCEDAAGIIDQLLEDCWNEADGHYKEAFYGTLKSLPYRDPFKALLLKVQCYRCAYCMKDLYPDHTTTMEHIIPESADMDTFRAYDHPFFTDHIVFKGVFNRHKHIIPPVRYPHDIAYHNLIASCNSNAHCNHKRGNTYLQPLVYDEHIADKVEYDKSGHAYSEVYLDELDTLGISTNADLILYRRMWARIAQQGIALNDIIDQTILEILLDLLEDEYDPGQIRIIDNFFGNPSKEQDFLRYCWFHDYYTGHQ